MATSNDKPDSKGTGEGNPQKAAELLECDEHNFAVVDILPLTLEEIFIYEMGGVDYEVKDILF